MINKPFRLILPILTCILMWSSEGFAQNATRSPYSFSGIGDVSYPGFANHVGMGRTGRSFKADNEFSFLNPASYAHLKLTSMQMGARVDLGKSTINKESSNFSNATFGYFSIAFPLLEKRGLAIAVGLLPHSSVGYNLTGIDNIDTIEIRNNYSGKGGISKAYLGAGIKLGKNIAVGANFNFLFGNINENQARFYLNNKDLFSYVSEKNSHLSGFTSDLGVQYTGQSKKGIEHTLGLTYHAGNKVNADQTKLVRTFNSQGGFYIDTIQYVKLEKGNIKLPTGFGAAYAINDPNHWGISAEWSSYKWSNFENFGVNPGFKNSSTFSLGGYFQPSKSLEKSSLKSERFKNYLKYIKYTAGGYYHQSYVLVNSTQINEIGTCFGVQLPVVRQIKLPGGEQLTLTSRLNITAELARRGTTNQGLLQEDYIRIYLGFSFSDKWFIKRRYL